jgi:hypothetical protein
MSVPAPELFVQLGLLDAEKLQRCLEFQKTFEQQGAPIALGTVIVNLGLAKPEQVARVLAHQGTANLRCPGCGRRYMVPDFQAQRRYKCEPCKQYLEVVVEEPVAPPPASAAAPASPRPTTVAGKKDPFEGRVLGGKYQIVRRLGKGGMGAVYLGERLTDRKAFAVKILTEEFSKMPGIEGRFKREGASSGRLDHPSIAETVEMGRDGGSIYIVMELLEGGTLVDHIVKVRRLEPAAAAEMMSDILSGLSHAHSRGVIHRDIKPGNILLTSAGKAKIIDFGLAKDAEAQTILTLSGNIVGTPAYMAPEQAKGETVDWRSDLYSCGIMFWLMLTGKKPFEAKSIVDTLNKQINEPLPSARAVNPDVPEALDAVLAKMCAKDPARRHRSCEEAIVALRKATGLPPLPGLEKVPSGPGAAGEWALVGGVLAAGTLLWAVLWWIMNR